MDDKSVGPQIKSEKTIAVPVSNPVNDEFDTTN